MIEDEKRRGVKKLYYGSKETEFKFVKNHEFKRSKQNLLLCAGSAVNTLMVSGYPVLDGQSRSQFTSSSASTTLSLAAIGLHNEETVSHTLPHCAANARITSNVIVSNLY